jgi:hypothetical protein
VVLGLGVAFSPGQVPGLTLPDSEQARGAMMHMHGGTMKGDPMKGEPTKRDSMKGAR